ncbi:YopX family protein [Bacillus wiedmannii]|uniref:YopX family protein n=1 Tax=Bacillus wiedmannii TaxID=1890302 RepID=UPI0021D2B9B1|nr:YopX family protein [Bacillus wiedmannii]MCU5414679.1 YopX family protein [Bacillus wiedmannii]
MDEIKLKAWDTANQEMYEVGYIDFANKKAQLAIIKEEVCYKQFVTDLKDVKLLQYSGETDVHGKEIFEGDIVFQEFHDRITENHGFTGVVKQEDGSWWICNGIDHAELLWSEININHVKGNIYENVELLENWGK